MYTMEEGDPTGDHSNQEQSGQVMAVNEEDMLEVIEVNDDQEDGVADEIEDLDLDEEAEEGAEGAEEPMSDDATTVFSKHTGSVFCVSMNPVSHSMAVSGGEDDKAFVWNVHTGETLLECLGHTDSVTCVGFSHDGSMVATGDMSGDIKVWSLSAKKEVWSFQIGDLEWLEWHQAAPVLLAGTTDGSVWMWKVPAGDCKTFQSCGCACSVGKVMPDGKRACVGYADGSVRLWDLKATTPVQTYAGKTGHQSSITCMDCHHDNNMVATGSTDVTAKIFSTAGNKVVATLSCGAPSTETQENSVEAVGFSRVQPHLATGTLEGTLNIWDVPTQVSRQKCQHEAGIVRLSWDHHAPLVYTCTLDGVVNMWDSRTGSREAMWYGHDSGILDMDVARDSSVVVTASEDSTARVFTLQAVDR